MFASLSSRVIAVGVSVLVALVALTLLLVDGGLQTSESFKAVTHSADVIQTTDAALGDLREAESGQRGFVITHDLAYAQTFDRRIAGSNKNMARVVALTIDNPLQHARAGEIAALIAQRSKIMRQPLDLGRRNDFAGAGAMIGRGRGRELMDAIAVRAQGFLDEERTLQAQRGEAPTAGSRAASGSPASARWR